MNYHLSKRLFAGWLVHLSACVTVWLSQSYCATDSSSFNFLTPPDFKRNTENMNICISMLTQVINIS